MAAKSMAAFVMWPFASSRGTPNIFAIPELDDWYVRWYRQTAVARPKKTAERIWKRRFRCNAKASSTDFSISSSQTIPFCCFWCDLRTLDCVRCLTIGVRPVVAAEEPFFLPQNMLLLLGLAPRVRLHKRRRSL